MKNHFFIRRIILIAWFIFWGILALFPQTNSNLILWQLPSQIQTIYHSELPPAIEIRELMDSLGIKEHYLSFEGLTKID